MLLCRVCRFSKLKSGYCLHCNQQDHSEASEDLETVYSKTQPDYEPRVEAQRMNQSAAGGVRIEGIRLCLRLPKCSGNKELNLGC